MVVFPAHGLASTIVEILRKGPMETAHLIKHVQTNTHGVTIQGIYKSLRLLQKQGIVLVNKKEAVLNHVWLRQVEKFALLAEHAYRNPISDSGHFLQMLDGDRITYEFKNPIQTDIFWNHLLFLLFDAFPNVHQWYAYASHSWFLIARRDDELALHSELATRGIQCLVTTGHQTPLDRLVAKDFHGEGSQYHMRTEPLFYNRANHLGIVLNIFGDYVIEGQYSRQTTESIEKFYRNNTTLTPENQAELTAAVSMPSRITLKVTRNAVKAEKLSRMFQKNFYITKQK